MSTNLDELQPFDLNEYDLGDAGAGTPPPGSSPREGQHELPEQTQMEEDLGVQDLGVDDVVNQSAIRRTRPKLDAEKLLNKRKGYPALLRGLRKVKYRGSGDEKKFLRKYVMTYQIWANRLWPKANFDDFILLARRAGKDPQVRQYCRDLIENEKYGGSMDEDPLPADADIYEPSNAEAPAAEIPRDGDSLDIDRDQDGIPDQHQQDPVEGSGSIESERIPGGEVERSNNGSPESSVRVGAQFPDEPENHPEEPANNADKPNDNNSNQFEGPDDDELEAAMELYGDMGF